MRIVEMSSPLRVVAILLALLGSAVVHAIPAPADVAPLEPSDRHGKVSRLVTTLFERSHYNRAPIDDAVSARIFDAYLESIDGGRQYFLASDIEEFEPLRNRLDDAVKRGQLQPVFDIYERYVERARDRMEFAIAQLDTSRISPWTRSSSSTAPSCPGRRTRPNWTRSGASASRTTR